MMGIRRNSLIRSQKKNLSGKNSVTLKLKLMAMDHCRDRNKILNKI